MRGISPDSGRSMPARRMSIGLKAGKASARVLAAVLVTAVFAPASALGAAPNDDQGAAIGLQLGFLSLQNNADATIEANEGFTPNDSAGQYCSNASGVNTTQGVKMDHTLWWGFTGDGGPVTVSSDESPDIDTVMAIYEKDERTAHRMQRRSSAARPRTAVSRVPRQVRDDHRLRSGTPVPRAARRLHRADVPVQCDQPTVGDLTLRVSATPDNDDRANAAPIVAGGRGRDNTTRAPRARTAKPASCANSLYAKTIWFRYTAPPRARRASRSRDPEHCEHRARGLSWQLQPPLACNDDALAGTPGGSAYPRCSRRAARRGPSRRLLRPGRRLLRRRVLNGSVAPRPDERPSPVHRRHRHRQRRLPPRHRLRRLNAADPSRRPRRSRTTRSTRTATESQRTTRTPTARWHDRLAVIATMPTLPSTPARSRCPGTPLTRTATG